MKYTKKMLNERAKAYTHLTKKSIESSAKSYKTERGLINHLESANAAAKAEHEKALPIYIEIEVNWHNSATWGFCPSVDLRWCDANREWHYQERAGYASGCGYDKHSAAVASALNAYFKNLRYAIRNKDFKKSPYGIKKCNYEYSYFEGGVGMSCYPCIFDWLGFDMKHVTSAKMFDKWVIVKKSEKKRFA